jgi:hypothetical protein
MQPFNTLFGRQLCGRRTLLRQILWWKYWHTACGPLEYAECAVQHRQARHRASWMSVTPRTKMSGAWDLLWNIRLRQRSGFKHTDFSRSFGKWHRFFPFRKMLQCECVSCISCSTFHAPKPDATGWNASDSYCCENLNTVLTKGWRQ